MSRRGSGREDWRGFLGRLRRDVRGNTLAMMAAMLIPLCALSGSAIDMARMYAVKTRLQQACDAGVLAGRKSMMTRTVSTLDQTAIDQANAFFKNNFTSGWFSTKDVSLDLPTAKQSQNRVYGEAKATVPMTIMRMFKQPEKVLTATCEAQYDIADADIVFVLDTTGSMACLISDAPADCTSYAGGNVNSDTIGYYVTEKTGSTPALKSRLENLRTAVSSFYQTLTSQADPSTTFRFAFMPYSATVNVGGLLKRSYLAANTWKYQTRWYLRDDKNGSPVNVQITKINSADCNRMVGTKDAAYTLNTSQTSKTAAGYTKYEYLSLVSYTSGSGGTCTLKAQSWKAMFAYQQKDLDVSSYAAGATVGNPALASVLVDTSTWNGCIEERDPNTAAPATISATSPPFDVDVDTEPTSTRTQWGPMWTDVEYARTDNTTYEEASGYRTPLSRSSGSNWGEAADYMNQLPCPRPAQGLQKMSQNDVDNYLKFSAGLPCIWPHLSRRRNDLGYAPVRALAAAGHDRHAAPVHHLPHRRRHGNRRGYLRQSMAWKASTSA